MSERSRSLSELCRSSYRWSGGLLPRTLCWEWGLLPRTLCWEWGLLPRTLCWGWGTPSADFVLGTLPQFRGGQSGKLLCADPTPQTDGAGGGGPSCGRKKRSSTAVDYFIWRRFSAAVDYYEKTRLCRIWRTLGLSFKKAGHDVSSLRWPRPLCCTWRRIIFIVCEEGTARTRTLPFRTA